ncbi:MAG: ATP-binding protein [Bacteroidetes bacterium]|nr:ATP-binding protein [Bacteroidota bacterium]
MRLYQELEKRVALRTTQLETVNKELEAFSYSVSHDLQAPLRHINGFIRLFLENRTSPLTEEELGYLSVVSNSVGEMQKLIQALLSFSKLNLTEIRKIPIDMGQLVQLGFQLFEEDIKTRSIEIKKGFLPKTTGDYPLIRQVWANLISNAIKYTSKKEKAVIEVGSYSQDQGTVYFIKDNGAGFDMKYADNLFGVFKRFHKPTDFEGIGIGLATVNRIITRHGGRCWAEAEPDKGATFYFSLPDK